MNIITKKHLNKSACGRAARSLPAEGQTCLTQVHTSCHTGDLCVHTPTLTYTHIHTHKCLAGLKIPSTSPQTNSLALEPKFRLTGFTGTEIKLILITAENEDDFPKCITVNYCEMFIHHWAAFVRCDSCFGQDSREGDVRERRGGRNKRRRRQDARGKERATPPHSKAKGHCSQF